LVTSASDAAKATARCEQCPRCHDGKIPGLAGTTTTLQPATLVLGFGFGTNDATLPAGVQRCEVGLLPRVDALSLAFAMASLKRRRSLGDSLSASCRSQWAASAPCRSHFKMLFTAAASTMFISPFSAISAFSTWRRSAFTLCSMYLHPLGSLPPRMPCRWALQLPTGGPIRLGAALAGAFVAVVAIVCGFAWLGAIWACFAGIAAFLPCNMYCAAYGAQGRYVGWVRLVWGCAGPCCAGRLGAYWFLGSGLASCCCSCHWRWILQHYAP
jgi:hypothetical protein